LRLRNLLLHWNDPLVLTLQPEQTHEHGFCGECSRTLMRRRRLASYPAAGALRNSGCTFRWRIRNESRTQVSNPERLLHADKFVDVHVASKVCTEMVTMCSSTSSPRLQAASLALMTQLVSAGCVLAGWDGWWEGTSLAAQHWKLAELLVVFLHHSARAASGGKVDIIDSSHIYLLVYWVRAI